MKRMKWPVSALLVALLVATTPTVGPASHPAVPEAATATVAGGGFLETLGCLGCSIVIYGASGGTVLGFVAFMAAFPDVVGACGFACVVAISSLKE